MHNSFEPNSVEQVLEAYLAASPAPSREILAEWIARYPQYEQQLADFTVAWIQSERLPAHDDGEIDAAHTAQLAMAVARRAYDNATSQVPQQTSPPSPLGSFLQEAKNLGLPVETFAQHLGLSIALLRKLENRLLLLETIPLQLIENVADVLKRGMREVTLYLAQPPMLPRGLRLRARQRPAIPAQQSFFDAVRSDESLNPSQRAYWLGFENKME